MPLNTLILISNPNCADRCWMFFSICITSTTHMVQKPRWYEGCGTMQTVGQKSIRILLKVVWNWNQDLWLWLVAEDDQSGYFVSQIHALVHPLVQDGLFSPCPGCCTMVPNPNLNGCSAFWTSEQFGVIILHHCERRKVLMKLRKVFFFR